MISKRCFYKTIIRVEVLSEDIPPEFDDLSELAHMIRDGDCSGVYEVESSKPMHAMQAVRALVKQGSEPEFFNLNGKGEEIS